MSKQELSIQLLSDNMQKSLGRKDKIIEDLIA